MIKSIKSNKKKRFTISELWIQKQVKLFQNLNN